MNDENNKRASADFEIGQVKAKFKGSEDFVQRNVDKYLEPLTEIARQLQPPPDTIVIDSQPRQLPLEMASSVSATRQDDDALEDEARKVVSGNKKNTKPLDFPTFYRKKNPKSQWQEIVVISYYYQKHEDYEYLSYKDLEEAYLRLERVGVDRPSNLRQAVKAACEQEEKLLYKPERKRGVFALTDQGFEFVEKMTGLDTETKAS